MTAYYAIILGTGLYLVPTLAYVAGCCVRK